MKMSVKSGAGITALCLFAVACVSARGPAHATQCVIRSEGSLGISASRVELAPGEHLQLDRPMLFVAPFLPPDTIPTGCSVRWSVTGPATISNSGLLVVAADAAPGAAVLVSAQVGTLVARQSVQVVDPSPNPLAATWTQDEPPTCANGSRPGDAMVRELVFRRGRTFSVTRVPFESYRDYWGTYTYDVSTGRLELVVENGNNLPGFAKTAMTARVGGGELIIEGPALAGVASGTGGCRAVFKRLGDPR